VALNELMLNEMLRQPADLATALPEMRAQIAPLHLSKPRQVVLTGSGDSGFAAMAVELAFSEMLGAPVWALPSASAARYGAGRLGGLTITISVSGEVRRTLEAAVAAKAAGGQVIAVTTAASSSLVGIADGAVIMPTPISRATPHTRDYTMTLLALFALLEGLAEATINELDAWPSQADGLIAQSMVWADRLAERHASNAAPVWFLGMGPDRGTAAYSALKFWEAGGSAAWWDDLEEFGHGSQLAARPRELAVLFATGKARGRVAEMRPGIEAMGLHTAVIGEQNDESDRDIALPSIAPRLSPLLSSIPPQALAYWFATRREIDVTRALGGDPLGEVYDAVHREWMRDSVILENPSTDGA
jgi:glucosamine--fructose-6-phosphate aminotransferase (isomerizing)